MRFDWTDLQVLLHVCEAGSMTAAARRCHLTLAAVSARIRHLEQANGLALLERQARGVTPTPAGQLLARHARLVFGQVQRMERELLHAQGDVAQRVLLLANSSALARPFAPVVAGSVEPGVQLVVRESASEASVQALRSGAADVAIGSDAVDTRGLVALDLGPDPLVLVAAASHPFARHGAVRFEQALEQPWIGLGDDGALATHLLLRALAMRRRIVPRITFPAVEGVLQLVAAGAGVTVLPLALVRRQAAAAPLACVPLEDPWARRRLCACRMAGDAVRRDRLAQELARAWPALG